MPDVSGGNLNTKLLKRSFLLPEARDFSHEWFTEVNRTDGKLMLINLHNICSIEPNGNTNDGEHESDGMSVISFVDGRQIVVNADYGDIYNCLEKDDYIAFSTC